MSRNFKIIELILFAFGIVSLGFPEFTLADLPKPDSTIRNSNGSWKKIVQNEKQIVLSSPKGVIYFETTKIDENFLTPVKSLRLTAEEAYDGERPIPVDEFKEIAPGLFAGNFTVELRSYVNHRQEKARIIIHGDSDFFLKIIGTTSTQDFDFLTANVDRFALEYYKYLLQKQTEIVQRIAQEPDSTREEEEFDLLLHGDLEP